MLINCPLEPSVVGKVNPLIVTPPEPFPVNSKGAFDALDVIVLSDIVTPSITADVVAVKVVNVPANGVAAPIIVLSIFPPPMSTSSITTFPDPFADISKLAFEAFVVIVLSLILT